MCSEVNPFASFDLRGRPGILIHFNMSSFCSVGCQPAARLELNVTEQEENVPMVWDYSVDGSTRPSGIDYEDAEEDEEEEDQDPAVPMYIVDDSIRGELK